MTGRFVLAASIPGRCAAPPAPATITRMPRASARLRVPEQQVRRAVRGHDPELARDPEGLEHHGRLLEAREVRPGPPDDADARPALRLVHPPQSSQRSDDAAARARVSADSASSPTMVTWPILRRSNTRRLP